MKTVNGVQIASSLEDVLDPARAALVIYDMQAGICSQVADAAVVTVAVARVLQAARAAGMRVIFTRHMSLPLVWMGAMAFRTAMAWQRTEDPHAVKPWFLPDSPDFALTPELAPLAGEVVLDKITMSAFEGTPLSIMLRDCGLTAVVFVGIALEIGIEPSVRHAADLGFVPVVVTDACGWGHQAAAERTLDALRFAGDAILTDIENLERTLAGRSKA
jgi:nicotinamidase-related amidase